MSKILIIDDDADICLLLKKFLEKKGYEVATAKNGKQGEEIFKETFFDVILCDLKLPDYSGIEMLQKIKIIHPKSLVIIITGYGDVKLAVDAFKKGASDYVTKPLYPDEILLTIKNVLQKAHSVEQGVPVKNTTSPAPQTNTWEYIVGESPQAKTVYKNIQLIAPTDLSVIISGETGTGKEYVARAIHQLSKRSAKPFVAIDCGSLTKDLASSELFGHIKGAFTGAIQDKKGSFELANGGTLFLDEIGNLSYENQVKLLRVLQERKVRAVGGSKDVPIDVRVIVATNDNLKQSIMAGSFREDIYHRLNEFKIELSPLRERPDDIHTFAKLFIQNANKVLGKSVDNLEEKALSILKKYQWYGNLRELKNVMQRAVLLSADRLITRDHLPQELFLPVTEEEELQVAEQSGQPLPLKEVVEQAEKQAILFALTYHAFNKSKTAEALRVDRKTLYNKLKQYNIEP